MASRLLAIAAARLAGLEARDLELGLHALRGLLEGDLEVIAEVVAAPRPRPAIAATPTEEAEALEEVLDDGAEADIGPSADAGRRPEAVVVGALVGIGQDRVRLADLLEALLGFLVAGIAIGMVRPREVAVGFLQLAVVGVTADAENRVVVAGRHFRQPGEWARSG